mmetsp:Transcript_25856/g.39338  ORF Transcript_25856/g.39338 Transcript_25856/m.39338 type:complete len:343 (-) Transcript_25856:326-1354(-)|eukprot:CAMPEP_0206571918 /NCGR_PEP_ID=MMETSP0325_2-20121206/27935_1 /ASSEMBLY_ACC=CAM_ASM_000347 /TAXON_ID=2866 /ORGANISM="Crypthecodinium cohnii, Strain Seligo" /LENGTH=342 /DNA_ID=CAMNT_0054076021 /DNA_START=75 /DNA_END=1103 /DNA_ORIENTATION=+
MGGHDSYGLADVVTSRVCRTESSPQTSFYEKAYPSTAAEPHKQGLRSLEGGQTASTSSNSPLRDWIETEAKVWSAAISTIWQYTQGNSVADEIRDLATEGGKFSDKEALRMMRGFCGHYHNGSIVPASSEIEALWKCCRDLDDSSIVEALQDQLEWKEGYSCWQSRLRALCVLDVFFVKSLNGDLRFASCCGALRTCLPALLKVPECKALATELMLELQFRPEEAPMPSPQKAPQTKSERWLRNLMCNADCNANGLCEDQYERNVFQEYERTLLLDDPFHDSGYPNALGTFETASSLMTTEQIAARRERDCQFFHQGFAEDRRSDDDVRFDDTKSLFSPSGI